MILRQLLIVSLVLFSATPLYADCLINGQTIAEGAADPNDGCLVCDSTQNGTAYVPRDCSATVTDECEVAVCRAGLCQPIDLPARTRCAPPVCTDGVVTQSECDENGVCQPNASTRMCDGFACLDAMACARSCDVNTPCVTGFSCVAGVCQRDGGGDDMGVADMGPDAAPDSGNNNVNNVNNSNNVNNINNVNNVNNVNNANNVNNNNGNGGDEDGGCCATQRAADSSVVVWCLFALIALRRRRVTSRA